jgi:uncharacterized protein with HEPN domain
LARHPRQHSEAFLLAVTQAAVEGLFCIGEMLQRVRHALEPISIAAQALDRIEWRLIAASRKSVAIDLQQLAKSRFKGGPVFFLLWREM